MWQSQVVHVYDNEIEGLANNLGKSGWELVNIVPNAGMWPFLAIFKKFIDDPRIPRTPVKLAGEE